MIQGDGARERLPEDHSDLRAGNKNRPVLSTQALLLISLKKWALGWTVTFLGVAMIIAIGILVFWPVL